MDHFGVRNRRPLERSLNVCFHCGGSDRWLDANLVAHTHHAEQGANAVGCSLLLKLPIDIARQRDPTAFDHHLNRTSGQRCCPLQHVFYRFRDVGIGALAQAGQVHLERSGERFDARYTLRCPLGIPFLCVAIDLTGQGHHAVFHFYADARGMYRRFPVEFFADVVLQLAVGLHGGASGWLV